jgi:hypothetical protein
MGFFWEPTVAKKLPCLFFVSTLFLIPRLPAFDLLPPLPGLELGRLSLGCRGRRPSSCRRRWNPFLLPRLGGPDPIVLLEGTCIQD